MSNTPVICFGQQPCGFYPKRFLFAKIQTARRLQKEIGGEIIFFYHDSDHDPRETRTILRHRKTKGPLAHSTLFPSARWDARHFNAKSRGDAQRTLPHFSTAVDCT